VAVALAGGKLLFLLLLGHGHGGGSVVVIAGDRAAVLA
jgi:hypothetical protein